MKTHTRAFLQLGVVFTVISSIAAMASSPAAAEVILTPSSGPPGSKVTARGSSAAAGVTCTTVEVFFGAIRHSDGHVVAQGTRVGSGGCDGAGRYSVPFTVPTTAGAGTTQVLVVGKGANGQSAGEEVATFTVT